ncbi:MAG: DUF484 family protein [Thiohalophilus sp.]|uniref:DUF484 family protein n=1 Tax=Thiohalophilus sp. TaxID=3028392 RepID=UPI0028707D7B|nr:DUF484 family protein [Thiohalophilus sp.]MDR9435586.1 DUF484 family protein [Thiohalophilus sp.]
MSNNALLDENRQLRRKLKAYEANASRNEQKLRRFQDHELRFISASGVHELLVAIFNEYRDEFRLDALTLLLIDPEYEIRRVMENLDITAHSHPDLLFVEDAAPLQAYFNEHFHPRLGSCNESCYQFLFPNTGTLPSCMALFPLVRQGKLIGSLNIGSYEPQRYIQGVATDFLERLAAIVAVCLESAINSEKLKLLGLLDPLTGVHNRRYFDERLEEETDRSLREQAELSCLFLDIDHFKQFNDNHGHHIGDLVLRDVATLIKRQMRSSDVMARFGGEEFAALLVRTDKHEAMDIAERIRASIARHQPHDADGQPLHITISIGCASLAGNPDVAAQSAAHHLLQQADKALYRAKQSGRNRIDYSLAETSDLRNRSA